MPARFANRFGFLAALALVVAVVVGGPAAAQSLDDLRAAGVVGERFDGLVEVRDTKASAQVRSLVEKVNAKRREIYAQRAAEQGVSAEQVGRVYAEKIFQGAPAGTWFRDQAGEWRRK